MTWAHFCAAHESRPNFKLDLFDFDEFGKIQVAESFVVISWYVEDTLINTNFLQAIEMWDQIIETRIRFTSNLEPHRFYLLDEDLVQNFAPVLLNFLGNLDGKIDHFDVLFQDLVHKVHVWDARLVQLG